MISMKDFNNKQLKLLRRWLGNPRFLNKNTDSQHIQMIKNCIETLTYNDVDGNHLMHIRQRWIDFLIQERELVYLTRKQKNIIINEMLNSKKRFRTSLSEQEKQFLVETINNGYYIKKLKSTFDSIFFKWEFITEEDDLPF